MNLLLVPKIFDIAREPYDPETFDEAAEEARITV